MFLFPKRDDDRTLQGNLAYGCATGALMFGLLAVPVIGCAMAIIYNNPWWLLLLLPLFAFMEAGLFLGAVALLTVSSIMRW